MKFKFVKVYLSRSRSEYLSTFGKAHSMGALRMYRCVLVIFGVFLLAGCANMRVPTAQEQHKALDLVDQGVREMRLGDLVRARMNFLLSYELVESAAALDGIGCVALLEKKYDEAEIAFIRVMKAFPEYTQVYANMALLLEQRGANDRAMDYYQTALDLQPDDFKVRNNYAVLLQKLGKKAEARVQLLKAEALMRHPLITTNQDFLE